MNTLQTIYLNPIFFAEINNERSIHDKVLLTGQNTGNMVFVDAIKKQLRYNKEVAVNDESLQDLGRNKIGVLSCANMINISSNYIENIEKRFQKIGFPITLVGLGAQSTQELDTPKKLMRALPKERINGLQTICNKVVSIGIRGDFTAECLDLIGVHNYRIIGCPSVYQSENSYENMQQATSYNCVINIATNMKNEFNILDIAMSKNMKWIMQSMSELPRTVYENCLLTDELVQKRFPGYSKDISSLETYMKNNANIFFDMKDWYTFMANEAFTFSFGCRFHGNVVALRSGIPALWIVHDSRTRELVEHFHLPCIDYRMLDKVKHVEDLIGHCSYHGFKRMYKKLFKEYVDFLNENGIDHDLH